jgi:hypothetical protein
MSWTKRQIIDQAMTELGVAAYDFDANPSELQDALLSLDMMMGVWINKGIVFTPTAYPVSTDQTVGSLSEDTNAPLEAIPAMYYNLALEIAAMFGKQASPSTMGKAAATFGLIMGNKTIPEVSFIGALRGAGAKRPLSPFITTDPETT